MRPSLDSLLVAAVVDEQASFGVDLEGAASLARFVLEAEEVPPPAELSIAFVEEAAIATLNETYRGGRGPTDVLSFSLAGDEILLYRGESPGGEGAQDPGRSQRKRSSKISREPADVLSAGRCSLMLGDVIICPAVANRNATEHGVDLASEVELLVVHGILHILGMDHEEAQEAEIMESREKALLDAYRSTAEPGRAHISDAP